MDVTHYPTRLDLLQRLNRLVPTLWLKTSVALHAVALGGVLADRRLWPWCVVAVVLNHAVLVAGGLLPRSRLLGPNWTRLPRAASCVALTIDDGPDPEVTPAVLDLLARHGVRATFFCIGERVARHPQLARRIAREGHEIGNHSEHHRYVFSLFGPAAIRREVGAAQASIRAAARSFRGTSGPRRDCATRSCSRAWRTWTCSWRAGRAAATTPSTPTPR